MSALNSIALKILQKGSTNSEKEFSLFFGHNWINEFDESKSVMVGDREVDMEAARKFGVRGIKCSPEEGLPGVINQIFLYQIRLINQWKRLIISEKIAQMMFFLP